MTMILLSAASGLTEIPGVETAMDVDATAAGLQTLTNPQEESIMSHGPRNGEF